VVYVSVCCVGQKGWTDRDAVWGRANTSESKVPRIRWDQDRTNPLAAARDDKSAMRPFAKLFWTLDEFWK